MLLMSSVYQEGVTKSTIPAKLSKQYDQQTAPYPKKRQRLRAQIAGRAPRAFARSGAVGHQYGGNSKSGFSTKRRRR